MNEWNYITIIKDLKKTNKIRTIYQNEEEFEMIKEIINKMIIFEVKVIKD